MGFLKTKIRETKPKKKGLVGKLDVSEIAQDLHLGRSSRVELSRVAAMGLFFYFVLITLLDAYVSLFFLLFSSFNPHVLRFIVLARRWTGVE